MKSSGRGFRKTCKRSSNVRERRGFSLVEVMMAVLIIGAGVIPVIAVFLQSSRTVEKGGAILEATIAAQNILDRARSDAFLWGHIPLDTPIPDEKFPQFQLPGFFKDKYKASGTLKIEQAPGHTVLGTGANEQNLVQLTVTVNWVENSTARTSRLITYRANTNSFDLKTSSRF
ncbi:MAG: prepilin-type N-terminal cleavage/methylation domain-containing protein [Candidatus Ozemobacteraceae bacterium]